MRALLLALLLWPQAAPGFSQPDAARHPDLYLWADTCNVWVIKDGDAALLIDLGDGSVLDRLADIGVKTVEWVLFTHHHREQLQGAPKLPKGVKIGGPEAERDLFQNPSKYRKMQVRLSDRWTVHGASYVRPGVHPVTLDRGFGRMDTFEWRGRTFWCLDTKGNSPGSMTYALKRADRWLTFTGDLMLADARMHTWFDTEWDYGFASGIHAIASSAGQVQGFDPEWLLPSHGPPVRDAAPVLAEYQKKLRTLERHLVRGYDVSTFSGAVQDKLSRPTDVPYVWRVSPHLYKFRGPGFYPNLCLIVADSGRALAVDAGLFEPKFLDDALGKLGIKSIDALIVTHMHGDHFLNAPLLQSKYGTKIWMLDRMVAPCERPEDFDYSAPVQAYGAGFDRVKVDRAFKDGERFEWEGFTFQIDWMPGQTEFALGMHGMIDGRKVLFTGDNVFGDPDDPRHTGHEAVNARNSAVLEEGYIYCGEYMKRVAPDLMMGGHSYVMDKPAAMIERFRAWSYEMRDAFRALSPDDDYRYFFDPFWVRAEPYRVKVPAGGSVEVGVHVRNFRARKQSHRIAVHGPAGLTADPPVLEGELGPEARRPFPLRLSAAADAKPGVHIVAFDVTLDGKRYGEWFDVVVEVTR